MKRQTQKQSARRMCQRWFLSRSRKWRRALCMACHLDCSTKYKKASLKAVDGLEDELRKTSRISSGDNINQFKDDGREKFNTELVSEFIRSHTTPMKRVVGLLSVDELAKLAEILVRMESIKERVTRETEEVSGPIDVAVIT